MVMTPEYLNRVAKKAPIQPAVESTPQKNEAVFKKDDFQFTVEDAVTSFLKRNKEAKFEDFRLAFQKQGLSFMGDNMLKAILEVEKKKGNCEIIEDGNSFKIISNHTISNP